MKKVTTKEEISSQEKSLQANATDVLFYHTPANKHLINEGISGRVTICVKKQVTQQEEGSFTALLFGAARCSEYDQFSKRKGRELSQYRAENKPLFVITMQTKNATPKVITRLMQTLSIPVLLKEELGIAILQGKAN